MTYHICWFGIGNDSSYFVEAAGKSTQLDYEQKIWKPLRSSAGYQPPAFGRCNLDPPLPFDFLIPHPDDTKEFFTWLLRDAFRDPSCKHQAGKTVPSNCTLLVAFESDFFEEQQGCIGEFNVNSSAADTWMRGFSGAAEALAIPVQMSMATPSNLLEALGLPALTNFRVSGDYANGGSWDIGWSSMLVWALGAAPSKVRCPPNQLPASTA